MNAQKAIYTLAKTAMMIALTVALQYYTGIWSGGNQLLTGSAVNFLLLTSLLTCGLAGGTAVGAITPLIGLLIGMMPNPLLYPFVAASNVLMLLTFYLFLLFLKRISFAPVKVVLALIPACFVKFGAMTFSASLILPLFMTAPQQVKMLEKIAVSWGVLQLSTALLGALLAFLVAMALRNIKINGNKLINYV